MPKVHNRHHKTAPPGAVYIGRGTIYGNPFIVGVHGTSEEVRQKFKVYVEGRPKLMAAIKEYLKGKDLVCSCAPKPCHGDYLLELANGEEDATNNTI